MNKELFAILRRYAKKETAGSSKMHSILNLAGEQVDNPQEVLRCAREVGRNIHDTGISYPKTAEKLMDWIELGHGDDREQGEGLEKATTYENFLKAISNC